MIRKSRPGSSDATVTFPKVDFTNKDTYDFSVTLEDRYGLIIEVNGDFSFDVPLFGGGNSIDVAVTNAAGNSVSHTARVTKLMQEEPEEEACKGTGGRAGTPRFYLNQKSICSK